jgi:membrane fusion protein, macrolide-specific efflux system
MTRTNAVFSFLLIAAIAGLSSCSGERTQTARTLETERGVQVLAAEPASVPDVLEAAGTVRAVQTSILASQRIGNVVEVRVHEGDRVERGQVLAAIDDSQPRAAMDRAIATDNATQQQLAAAESDLALAESTLKRYQCRFSTTCRKKETGFCPHIRTRRKTLQSVRHLSAEFR